MNDDDEPYFEEDTLMRCFNCDGLHHHTRCPHYDTQPKENK